MVDSRQIKNLFLIILSAVVLWLFLINNNKDKYITQYKSNELALADSVKYLKDKNGKEVAKIRALTSSKVKDIQDLVSKDKEIKKLQQTIKENEKKLKNNGSVTNFNSNTKIDTVFNTIVIKDTTSNFPIYISDINLDNWVTGQVKAKVDGVYVNLEIKNEYSIIIGQESQGLFKKKIPFASVTNYNPYSSVTSLRTYQVALPRRKRFHLGPSIIYDPLIGQVRLGVGITYNVFSF